MIEREPDITTESYLEFGFIVIERKRIAFAMSGWLQDLDVKCMLPNKSKHYLTTITAGYLANTQFFSISYQKLYKQSAVFAILKLYHVKHSLHLLKMLTELHNEKVT